MNDFYTVKSDESGRSVTAYNDYLLGAVAIRTGGGSERRLSAHERFTYGGSLREIAERAFREFDLLFPYEGSKSLMYQ